MRKLKLKAISESDRKFYIDLYGSEKLLRKICDPLDSCVIENNFNKLFESKRNNSIFIIHDLKINKKVGLVEIKKENERFEIGMMIKMEFHRKNYPVDTLLLIMEQLKQKLARFYITAKVKPDNRPINNIMKKFNFKQFDQCGKYNYWELLVEK